MLGELVIESIFNYLDYNNNGSLTKSEIKEVLEVNQNWLMNVPELMIFRSSVTRKWEDDRISLKELFDKYDNTGKYDKKGMLTIKEIEMMIKDCSNK